MTDDGQTDRSRSGKIYRISRNPLPCKSDSV